MQVRDQADQIEVLVAEITRLREKNSSAGTKPSDAAGLEARTKGALTDSFRRFNELVSQTAAGSDPAEKENQLWNDRLNLAVSKQLSQYEVSTRDMEIQVERLKSTVRQRDALVLEHEAHERKLADRVTSLTEATQKLEAQLKESRDTNDLCQQELSDTRTELAMTCTRETELTERVQSLEKLQVDAKETLLLSEARLRETLSRGPSSYTFADDAHLVAAGVQPGASSTSISGVQLWWLELAQQARRQPGAASDDIALNSGESSSGVGQRLVEGAARIQQLEHHVKEQGTEVVFLRQEIIARDIELRRVREDASERQLAAQRRVASLEQAVRTQSLDGATKIRELETAVRTLSRRSDAHGALAEARQQIAAERVQAIHREGELEVLRKMLEGEQEQHQLALAKTERMQLAAERNAVAKSVEDVPGADPLTLIEHFAGIAELQAVRIRELSEALAGKGDWTLTSGSGEGAASSHDKRRRLATGKWVRQWAQLEAHVLGKQNVNLKEDINRLGALNDRDLANLKEEMAILQKDLQISRTESAKAKRQLEKKLALAESQAAVVKDHLDCEVARTTKLQSELDGIREAADATKQMNDAATRGAAEAAATLSQPPAAVGGAAAGGEERREHMESLLAERTSQIGVLMETVEALQSTISGMAAGGSNHVGQIGMAAATPDSSLLQSVLKRVVKLTMETTSAMALASMNERRATQLSRSLQESERQACVAVQALRATEASLAEAKAAHEAFAAEAVKQRSDMRTEVKSMTMDLDMLQVKHQSVESEARAQREEVQESANKIELLEAELRASRAQVFASADAVRDAAGGHASHAARDDSDHTPDLAGNEVRELLRAFADGRTQVHAGGQPIPSSISARAAASREDEEVFMERVAQLLMQSDNACRRRSHDVTQLRRHLDDEKTARERAEWDLNHATRELELARRRMVQLEAHLASRDDTEAEQENRAVSALTHRVQHLFERLSESQRDLAAMAAEVQTHRKLTSHLKLQLAHYEVHETAEERLKQQNKATTQQITTTLQGVEGLLSRQEASLKQWFDTELVEMMGMASAAPGLGYGSETVAAMRSADSKFTITESLCAAKLMQSSLETKLEAATEQLDASMLRAAELEACLAESKKVFERELHAAEVGAAGGGMLNAHPGNPRGDPEEVDPGVRAVELEHRNFELEGTIQDLERQLRAASEELIAMQEAQADASLQAEADRLARGTDDATNRGDAQRIVSSRHSSSSDDSLKSSSRTSRKHDPLDVHSLERELNEQQNEVRRLAKEKDDAVQHTAMCRSELDARDIAVRKLEKALADVRMPDTDSDEGTTDKSTKKSSAKRGRASKTKEKSSKDHAALEHAVQRAAKLARKLTNATLDAANWQQKARELSLQLDSSRGAETATPHTPVHHEHSAPYEANSSPSSTDFDSPQSKIGRLSSQESASKSQSSGSDNGSRSSRLNPRRSTDLHRAMDSLSKQVHQLREVLPSDTGFRSMPSAAAPKAGSAPPRSPTAPLPPPPPPPMHHHHTSSENRHHPHAVMAVSELAVVKQLIVERDAEREQLQGTAARLENELSEKEKVITDLTSIRRQLLERISDLQSALLEVRRAAAVEMEESATDFHVSSKALVRLDLLLSGVDDGNGSTANPDVLNMMPEGITFNRLAERIRGLQSQHRGALEQLKEASQKSTETQRELESLRAEQSVQVESIERHGPTIAAEITASDNAIEVERVKVSTELLQLRTSLGQIKSGLAAAQLEYHSTSAPGTSLNDAPAGVLRDAVAECDGALVHVTKLEQDNLTLRQRLKSTKSDEGGGAKAPSFEAELHNEIVSTRQELLSARSAHWRETSALRERYEAAINDLEMQNNALSTQLEEVRDEVTRLHAQDADNEQAEPTSDVVTDQQREQIAAAELSLEQERRARTMAEVEADGAQKFRDQALKTAETAEELRAIEAEARVSAEKKRRDEAEARANVEIQLQEEIMHHRASETAREAAEEAREDLRAAVAKEKESRSTLEAELERLREQAESDRDVVENWTEMKNKLEDALESERGTHAEQIQILRAQFVRYRTAQHEVTSALEKQVRELRFRSHPDSGAPPTGARSTAKGGSTGVAPSRGRPSGASSGRGALRTNRSPSARPAGNGDTTVNDELLTQLQASEAEINRLNDELQELQFECSTKSAEAQAAVKVLSGTSVLQRGGTATQPSREHIHKSQRMLQETLSEVRIEVASQEVKRLQQLISQEREECSKLRTKNAAYVTQLSTMRQSKAPPRVQALLQQIARLKAQITAPAEGTTSASTKRQTDETLENTKAALQSAREDISRKGKLIASMRQSRCNDESALREAEAKQAGLEDKLKRAQNELTRRRSAMEEMQRRLGKDPQPSTSAMSQPDGAAVGAPSTMDGESDQAESLRGRLRAAAMDRARVKQQVNVLKAKIEQQSQRISELEGEVGTTKESEGKVSSFKAAVAQKETALKVTKTKLLGE